jgi:hypothetical protein
MCFAEIIDVGWWTAPNPADGIDLATVPKAIWRTRHVAKRLPTGT